MYIKPYHNDYKNIWNSFIKDSVNGTFLFDRDFMEYHSDRFNDASLMVFNDDALICCIPGNKKESNFYSHQGLTYGGFIFKKDLSKSQLEKVIHQVINDLKDNYASIEFRWQPYFYNDYQEHIISAMDQLGFQTRKKFDNLHIDLIHKIKTSSKKTVGYRNGKFDELRLEINHDFKSFWNQILIPQLKARHDASPVHSLEEIELLASRFPDSIKQYTIYKDQELLCGVTFFIKNNIVKSQYASASPDGLKVGALDFLYLEAIQRFKNEGLEYIDLGHVNNPDGTINRGLQRFKEELGGVNTAIYKSELTINEK